MATKDQYEFYRSLYDEEERTSLQLEGRAKIYLGVISAFLVTFLLNTDEVVRSAHTLGIPWWAILIEAVIFSAAMLCVIYSLRINVYEAVNDGSSLIDSYVGDGPTDEEFFEDRIADYAVASSRNRNVNNTTASVLAWAGWLLISGMILLLILVTFTFRS